jgi:uncharacterized protein (DUF736 family)
MHDTVVVSYNVDSIDDSKTIAADIVALAMTSDVLSLVILLNQNYVIITFADSAAARDFLKYSGYITNLGKIIQMELLSDLDNESFEKIVSEVKRNNFKSQSPAKPPRVRSPVRSPPLSPSPSRSPVRIPSAPRVPRVRPVNAEKKEKTGYLIFASEKSAEMRRQYPSAKPAELLTRIGAAWKALSDEEKAEYDAMSPIRSPNRSPVRSPPRVPNAPRVPRVRPVNAEKKEKTGYFIFASEKSAEMRKKHPSAKPAELSTRIGAAWKALSAEEKAEYYSMANM